MYRPHVVLLASIGVALASAALANEPGWTDQQRLEKRDVVCSGLVLSAERLTRIDDQMCASVAVVEVTGVKKGPKTSVGTKLYVYYEHPAVKEDKRCPACPELAKGDSATFYLRTLTQEIKTALKLETVPESALYLELGSDARAITGEITSVSEAEQTVEINLGLTAGLKPGDVLSMHRGQVPLGRVTLVKVDQEHSMARIDLFQGGVIAGVGDAVVQDATLKFLVGLRPGDMVEGAGEKGRTHAEADIRRGLGRILYFGKPWSRGKPFVDDETGKPVVIVDGCLVTSNFVLFVNAYNEKVRAHFQARDVRPK